MKKFVMDKRFIGQSVRDIGRRAALLQHVENIKQDDDRDRNADHPQDATFAHTLVLYCAVASTPGPSGGSACNKMQWRGAVTGATTIGARAHQAGTRAQP